jgi:hypothetical protein
MGYMPIYFCDSRGGRLPIYLSEVAAVVLDRGQAIQRRGHRPHQRDLLLQGTTFPSRVSPLFHLPIRDAIVHWQAQNVTQ